MAVKKELEQDLTDTDDLAEMMDSLMTNNFGETRYIGEHMRPPSLPGFCG